MDKYLFYKDFCIAFCNYAIKRIQSDTSLSDADISFCIEPIQEISKQYDNGEKRLIDKIYRMDIIEAFDYPDFLIENQKYFMDTYGVNILDLDKKKQNKIAKILERGKIKTDNEFRMILEHVDGSTCYYVIMRNLQKQNCKNAKSKHFIPTPPSIPCEFLGGVGFLFSRKHRIFFVRTIFPLHLSPIFGKATREREYRASGLIS